VHRGIGVGSLSSGDIDADSGSLRCSILLSTLGPQPSSAKAECCFQQSGSGKYFSPMIVACGGLRVATETNRVPDDQGFERNPEIQESPLRRAAWLGIHACSFGSNERGAESRPGLTSLIQAARLATGENSMWSSFGGSMLAGMEHAGVMGRKPAMQSAGHGASSTVPKSSDSAAPVCPSKRLPPDVARRGPSSGTAVPRTPRPFQKALA
jgi:hypothetical protein